MKRPVWLVLGVIAVVLVIYLALRSGGEENVEADLVAQFPQAVQKRPSPEVFSVVDATISGETKKAILVKDPSRLVYSVPVPDNAQLKVSLGLLEEGWTVPGDGVLFRVLVAPPNNPPEEILNQPLDPYNNPSDRGWHDLTLDLTEYAGETIELFFNTNSSLPTQRGQAPRDDRAGDSAVWGAPRVVSR